MPADAADRWPEVASHDEKVRRMFDEFDARKSRGVELDAFAGTFRKLNVGFSSATINDLFEKADSNKDHIISVGEFQRFAEVYPTMIDCLYYRARDFYTELSQRDSVDGAKMTLSQLREREMQARALRVQAQAQTDAAEHRLQQQMQALQDSQQHERGAKNGLDCAHDDTERTRAELQHRVAELTAQKDAERQRGAELAEVQRMVAAAARRSQLQDHERAKAEERLVEIERLLLEQQREVERSHTASEQVRAELAAVQGREQDAAAAEQDARRDVHLAADRVADAENEVGRQQQRERQAAQALRDAAAEVARQLAQRDAEQRELAATRERERLQEQDEHAARHAAEAQDRQVSILEQENADFQLRRRAVDEEEQPLLEQEVRLREQRESLECKESKLRSDFQHFAGRSTRPPPSGTSPRPPRAASPGGGSRAYFDARDRYDSGFDARYESRYESVARVESTRRHDDRSRHVDVFAQRESVRVSPRAQRGGGAY